MEVTQKATFEETIEENPVDNLSFDSSIIETTSTTEVLDPLTGENATEPLVGNFSGNFSLGNLSLENVNSVPADDTPNILEVTGRGIVSLDTDIAQVSLGIELEAATAGEVQQEIAQSSSAVVDLLNQLEVDELQTVSISLRPRREFDNSGNSTVVGFTGRNVLQFEVPVEEAGETIDAAVQAGANLVENISFVASDNELNQARLDAIRIAAQDAQTQADSLLDVLNLTPLEIVDIDIINVNNPAPRSFSAGLELAQFDVATPIIGGTQEISASVALDISYI